jgi:hypothetical protein
VRDTSAASRRFPVRFALRHDSREVEALIEDTSTRAARECVTAQDEELGPASCVHHGDIQLDLEWQPRAVRRDDHAIPRANTAAGDCYRRKRGRGGAIELQDGEVSRARIVQDHAATCEDLLAVNGDVDSEPDERIAENYPDLRAAFKRSLTVAAEAVPCRYDKIVVDQNSGAERRPGLLREAFARTEIQGGTAGLCAQQCGFRARSHQPMRKQECCARTQQRFPERQLDLVGFDAIVRFEHHGVSCEYVALSSRPAAQDRQGGR